MGTCFIVGLYSKGTRDEGFYFEGFVFQTSVWHCRTFASVHCRHFSCRAKVELIKELVCFIFLMRKLRRWICSDSDVTGAVDVCALCCTLSQMCVHVCVCCHACVLAVSGSAAQFTAQAFESWRMFVSSCVKFLSCMNDVPICKRHKLLHVNLSVPNVCTHLNMISYKLVFTTRGSGLQLYVHKYSS